MQSVNKSKQPIQIVSNTNPVSPPSTSFTHGLLAPVKRDMEATKSVVEVNRGKLYKEEESLQSI